MAKKRKAEAATATPAASVNKTQRIKDFMAGNPGSTAKETVAALASEGVTVSEGLVYYVKSTAGKTKTKGPRKVRATTKAAASVSSNGAHSPTGANGDFESVLKAVATAKKFVAALDGDAGQAKTVLHLVAELIQNTGGADNALKLVSAVVVGDA